MTQQPSHPSSQPLPSAEERTASILAHLSAIIAAVVSAGWLSIVGPLIVWALYKDRSPLARQAAAGAFNFNLAIWAAFIVGWICLFTIILIPVAVVLWIVAGLTALVCHIQGAVKANRNEPYRYPFEIRVLS
ncbi:DUF4870 domain-containing protein [Pedococcus sp. 5OH_020]|jgi:uncharacterized protein|uniref:DUF4870 domain-containing protein n=1 Tax=Pedococcus sp. 5OH_020 TaxID=2989814 RepID=UPI0022E9C05A|nr:DUF4870 domain-containing protein [Pedococcus sp. 5OH_020]